MAAKPEKEKYYRKYGKEAGDNKYKPKPKKKNHGACASASADGSHYG